MEEVFDLREFVIKILRRWRLLICMMILLGVLGGSFRLFQLRELLFYTPEIVENDMVDEMDELRNESQQMLITAQINALERNISSTENILLYLDREVRDSSYSLQFHIIVATADAAQTEQLTNQLFWHVTLNDSMFQWVSQQIDGAIPTEILREFIRVELVSGLGLIRVTVFGGNADFCTTVSMAVREYFESTNMSTLFGDEHHITSTNLDAEPILDNTLFHRRVELLNLLQTQNESIEGLELALEELQDYSMTLNEIIVSPGWLGAFRSAVQYGVFGLVGGLAAGVVLVFFIDVMSVKVRDGKELSKKLGVSIWVEVVNDQRKSLASKIDNLIDKIDGNTVARFSRTEAIDKLCADIAVTLRDSKRGYRLFIAGLVPSEVLSEIHESISANLVEDGIECILGGNLLISGDSTRAVEGCDGVLLVEQNGHAVLPEVEKEKAIVCAAGKEVLAALWVVT